jgi:hypothetical protein
MTEAQHISGPARKTEREMPDPSWVRGECPHCGEPVVSNAWYVGGRGYLIKLHCWNALGEEPTCNYERTP